MKAKTKLIIGGALVLVFIAVTVVRAQHGAQQGTLRLSIYPNDATVKVDGRSRNAGNIFLDPGSHQITVSKDGFETKSASVEIETNKYTTKDIGLEATSEKATDYYNSHPEQQAAAEGTVGSQISAGGSQTAVDNPILSKLPIYGEGYTVQMGVSVKHPEAGQFALYVYCGRTTDYCQGQLDQWMQQQGYKLSDYEVIYRSTNNSGH